MMIHKIELKVHHVPSQVQLASAVLGLTSEGTSVAAAWLSYKLGWGQIENTIVQELKSATMVQASGSSSNTTSGISREARPPYAVEARNEHAFCLQQELGVLTMQFALQKTQDVLRVSTAHLPAPSRFKVSGLERLLTPYSRSSFSFILTCVECSKKLVVVGASDEDVNLMRLSWIDYKGRGDELGPPTNTLTIVHDIYFFSQ
ncbi:hypothetical protein BDN72DRAFT_861815 [Pluteus cervinus]|uniref:Uncharacterized protein n=1 Tax=Pluteus cervinus TaxID=181527 RepID=A0ACD3AEI3_9AGAR|nr:hypothetical protein BDN72DRAFT_861815 [Pluteus cervinus]